ncbi:MAG: carboxyl transferase [Lachnospiraceae bacterium]|nr:carboxyl transferase [Lachnospiraceae bacterium]
MSTSNASSARQRIESLLDEKSFVEIGGLVSARATDFNLKQIDTPSDGVITGYGLINDVLVYVYSQDVSVINGTIGEMHAKKIASLYDLAMKMGAPVIGLIDSAGLRLQEAMDALNGLGEIYFKQSMASGVIPQVGAVFGSCGGGQCISMGINDFVFMEDKAKLFVNSPNTLKDNYTEKCDTASAEFMSAESGIVDFTGSEADVIAKIRELVSIIPSNNEEDALLADEEDDLNRASANLAGGYKDGVLALTDIADGYDFFEIKPEFGKDLVAGFIKLDGMTVGAMANRSVIYDEDGKVKEELGTAISVRGLEKAASFVNLCDAFNIPLLTLTNVSGFKSCVHCEKRIAKAAAALTYAFANATVPKVNLITELAFGSAGVVMNSKSLGCDVTFALEGAKIGTMDSKIAAQIIYDNDSSADLNAKAKEYDELQNSALSAAKRGYIDYIIKADEARKYIIGAFEMLYSKREDRPFKKHGTV